jgi:2-desacetyl-2-hydroxyethyl bacteriochlorophyllide A dehydrogenase
MKAAILKEKRTMVIEEAPTPQAGPGEVIVKVKDVGICGSDLHLYATGLLPPDTIMGHEVAGVIAEMGDGVEGWSVGEKVGIYGAIACGKCPTCKRGRANICQDTHGIGLGHYPGGYAEFIKVNPKMLVRVPQDINLRDVALLDPFSTAYHALWLAGLGLRDTALVIGAGPIGLCLIQQLKHAGARLVVVTEPVKRRADVAKRFGADLVLDPGDDVLNTLLELTDGVGVDYVFECVGIPATTADAFTFVRPTGKVVLVGVCMEAATVMPLFWMIKEVSMQTCMGFNRDEFETTLDLLCKGGLKSEGLVTETVSLEGMPDAFERLLSPNEEIKVLLENED